jgi:hypothetical protein
LTGNKLGSGFGRRFAFAGVESRGRGSHSLSIGTTPLEISWPKSCKLGARHPTPLGEVPPDQNVTRGSSLAQSCRLVEERPGSFIRPPIRRRRYNTSNCPCERE